MFALKHCLPETFHRIDLATAFEQGRCSRKPLFYRPHSPRHSSIEWDKLWTREKLLISHGSGRKILESKFSPDRRQKRVLLIRWLDQ